MVEEESHHFHFTDDSCQLSAVYLPCGEVDCGKETLGGPGCKTNKMIKLLLNIATYITFVPSLTVHGLLLTVEFEMAFCELMTP